MLSLPSFVLWCLNVTQAALRNSIKSAAKVTFADSIEEISQRLFPSGDEQKQYWKNWSPQEDLDGLQKWKNMFGPQFCPMLVFAYDILGDRSPLTEEETFVFRDHRYAFVAILLDIYAAHARPISQSWETVAMPTQAFREHARPFHLYLNEKIDDNSQGFNR